MKPFARRTAYNIQQSVARLEREQAEYRLRVNKLEQVNDGSPMGKRRMTLAKNKLRRIERDLEEVRRREPFEFTKQLDGVLHDL